MPMTICTVCSYIFIILLFGINVDSLKYKLSASKKVITSIISMSITILNICPQPYNVAIADSVTTISVLPAIVSSKPASTSASASVSTPAGTDTPVSVGVAVGVGTSTGVGTPALMTTVTLDSLKNEPQKFIAELKKRLAVKAKLMSDNKLYDIKDSQERVMTLKAYLDEIERDLFAKNWDNLQVYLYTFADQERAFITLINGLFPTNDQLDEAAREALSYEAQSMFMSLDFLRYAAKNKDMTSAIKSYSQLLLSYDRFLKAGDLYPTYDPITSTEIFYANTPLEYLRYDTKGKIKSLDNVLMTEGPDMGKTGTVILIEKKYAVVKLDKDGKDYQEVKLVNVKSIAKTFDNKTDNTKTPFKKQS